MSPLPCPLQLCYGTFRSTKGIISSQQSGFVILYTPTEVLYCAQCIHTFPFSTSRGFLCLAAWMPSIHVSGPLMSLMKQKSRTGPLGVSAVEEGRGGLDEHSKVLLSPGRSWMMKRRAREPGLIWMAISAMFVKASLITSQCCLA